MSSYNSNEKSQEHRNRLIAHLGYIKRLSANVLLEISVFRFQVIGNITSGSGWGNVAFWSEHSSPGSLQPQGRFQ